MNIRIQSPHPRLTEVRRYDGSGNNLSQPDLNKTDTVFLRRTPESYSDGIDTPSGLDRPNPREISNKVMNQRGRAQDERKLSNMVWAWGQFLDHDVTFTPNPGVPDWNIAVPAGDRHFDPEGKGQAIIPFARSSAAPGTGAGTGVPRRQFNGITGWIDGSQVYGSSPERAAALRTFDGGKLKTGENDMLPSNTMGLANDNPMRRPEEALLAAGDVRANENLGLLSLHTVFLREHNRLVEEFAKSDPSLSDEALYQMARKVVGAQVQHVTFNEFLPALLGEDAIKPYQGYQPQVDPRICNEFSTAAYRMGHSQIEPIIWREGADGQAIPERDLALLHAFFSPERLAEGGVDPILRGLTAFIQEPTDEDVSVALRNMLFGRPGKGGMDLAAINIQRGRDHGLPDYNTVREAFGLPAAQSFADISQEPEAIAKLQEAYGSVDKVDPWVGMLCEDHVPGSGVGPTIRAVLVDQFERLRDGDRFWYQNDPDLAPLREEIEKTSLTDIIRRNTDIGGEMDDTPFFGEKFQRKIR
ncbi:MAG: peroxidase family protein [Vulcanimicrobiota bacterium]